MATRGPTKKSPSPEGQDGPSDENIARKKSPNEEKEPSALESGEEKFESKQRCAATLRNWSLHHDNALRMVKEGAVQALVELAAGESSLLLWSRRELRIFFSYSDFPLVDDRKTKAYCATAFRNLSANPELRERLVAEGAVETIVELSASTDDETHKECATALCNLSMIHGAEAQVERDAFHIFLLMDQKDSAHSGLPSFCYQLVEAGAVLALMILMNDNDSLAAVCARAMFNLTCVDKPYLRIERSAELHIFFHRRRSTSRTDLALRPQSHQGLCRLGIYGQQ